MSTTRKATRPHKRLPDEPETFLIPTPRGDCELTIRWDKAELAARFVSGSYTGPSSNRCFGFLEFRPAMESGAGPRAMARPRVAVAAGAAKKRKVNPQTLRRKIARKAEKAALKRARKSELATCRDAVEPLNARRPRSSVQPTTYPFPIDPSAPRIGGAP